MREDGVEISAPPEGETRADRKHTREYIVLRGVVVFGDSPAASCGLMDISVSGAKLKYDDLPPDLGAPVVLSVESLKLHVRGKVIRIYQTPSGTEIAVKFDRIFNEVPSRLLDYKLKSIGSSGFGRR